MEFIIIIFVVAGLLFAAGRNKSLFGNKINPDEGTKIKQVASGAQTPAGLPVPSQSTGSSIFHDSSNGVLSPTQQAAALQTAVTTPVLPQPKISIPADQTFYDSGTQTVQQQPSPVALVQTKATPVTDQQLAQAAIVQGYVVLLTTPDLMNAWDGSFTGDNVPSVWFERVNTLDTASAEIVAGKVVLQDPFGNIIISSRDGNIFRVSKAAFVTTAVHI